MEPLCRICHSHEPPALIRPCSCRGTMSYVHAKCAEEWVVRRMKDGVPPTLAACCEICRDAYRHIIYTPHPVSFLTSWRRWLHLGYMLFVGRRIANELRGAVRVITPSGEKSRREVVSGVAFSLLMAAHYAVFFVVDARHLVLQYRRWRAAAATVHILDKNNNNNDDNV